MDALIDALSKGMSNTPHLVMTALLILAAFLVGAIVGALLKAVVLALTRKRPAAVAARTAEPVAAEVAPVAVVAEPEIVAAPEPVKPPYLAPADFAAVLQTLSGRANANANVAQMPAIAPLPVFNPPPPPIPLQPARIAGETTSGRLIASPRPKMATTPVAPAMPVPTMPTAEIIAFPAPVAEVPVAAPAFEMGAVTAELEALLSLPVEAAPAPDAFGGVLVSEDLETFAGVEEFGGPAIVDEDIEDDGLVIYAAEPEIAAAAPQPAAATAPEPEAPAEPEQPAVPLGLEAQLAEAMGASFDLTPYVAPEPEPKPEPVVPEPTVALAAFDIEMDGFEVEPAVTVSLDAVAEPEPEVPVVAAAEATVAYAAPVPIEASAAADDVIVGADEIGADDGIDLALMFEALSDDAPAGEDVKDPVAIAPPPPPVWPVDKADEEAAAMRAIEGNWSPRRISPRVARPAMIPEALDTAEDAVAASGAAVAEVTRKAAQIVADLVPHPDRPTGLEAPRNGMADDLTHIIGVLPVIETALNRLGVYHYDQIGDWSSDTVAWVEQHLGLEGRVSREQWRLQARALAESPPLRRVKY